MFGPMKTIGGKAQGFTLVELIVVIVLTGIIGVSIVVFFKPALDGYFDAQRRALLTDLADTALQRISRDVRSAVPNSIRTYSGGGATCFELLPTSTGGRYRMGPDIDDTHDPDTPLDITQQVTAFDVLSPLSSVPQANDWVVIGNQSVSDLYGTTETRAQLTADPEGGNGVREALLTVASHQFPTSYDGGRFVVVPDNGGEPAVIYVCSGTGVDANGNGTGTLFRATRGIGSALTACPAGGAVLSRRISNCSFIYDPNHGATQQSGYLWMQLELQEAGERIALVYGSHVSNVP